MFTDFESAISRKLTFNFSCTFDSFNLRLNNTREASLKEKDRELNMAKRADLKENEEESYSMTKI